MFLLPTFTYVSFQNDYFLLLFQILESISAIGNVKCDEKLDKLLAHVKSVTDRILLPSFQDITNMFSSGAIFFVDGDSLLLNLMGDVNYDTNNGGQLLHLIYLCERHLQLFSRKGGNFEIIFFNIWSQAWSGKHTLLLARSVLMSHLRFNMSCKVHEFDSVWDMNFRQVLEKCNCSFILTDFQMLDTYCKLHPNEDHVLQELIFHASICYSLVALYLGWVDMNNVELTVSTLNAFYCQPGVKLEDAKLRKLLHIITTAIQNECKLSLISNNTKKYKLLPTEGEKDVRHAITVAAAAQLLKESNASQKCENWIRTFLVYSAILEVLPLRFRGCAASVTPTTALTKFVQQLCNHMNRILQTILHGSHNVNYNFDNVSDLWHGNLFVFVLTYVTEHEMCEEFLLGKQTFSTYERLLQEVVKLAGKPLAQFPIIKQKVKFYESQKPQKKESQKEKPQMKKQHKQKLPKDTGTQSLPVQCLNHLIPTNCLLINEFCGDILPKEEKFIPDGALRAYITRNSDFKENRHWHSRIPMSDSFDRVRDTDLGKPTNKYEKRKYEDHRNKFARYMAIYGSSIEGRPLTVKSIVCEEAASSKNKHAKSPKRSKKAQKIIDDHIKQREAKVEESDRQMFKVFSDKYKEFKKRGNYEAALNEAKLLEKRLKTHYILQRILMRKADILWHLWQKECRTVNAISIRNLNYAKEIFLVVQRILREFGNVSLSVEDGKQLGHYLWQMGLERIAQCWKLPRPSGSTADTLYSIGVSWIDFQLLYLGPELERESGSKPDGRVEGFIPDAWQIELFDSVDRHQSVLVVAPTSSGKTYASYYCMERVLRDSNDGVVVYVAPTKALVNQVAATIYARFKNKRLPDGKSVYGVFTRDYRTNALNSQILVTVPECLELLLLSPRMHDWVKSLRYVIFDEIHCLAGQTGGFSWECCLLLIRCPFLALSATVEDPESLHRWLQNLQHFKEKQDIANSCEKPSDLYKVNLVVHKDRHSDLRKFVYCADEQLHHVHPYAYLDKTLVTYSQRIFDNISLSPAEVHDLYSAMKLVCPQDPQLQELDPEIFFSACTSGFISRNMVREFEAQLRKLLKKWALEGGEDFKSVIANLNSVSSSTGGVSESIFIENYIVNFVLKLQQEEMLPAIVFSYDRRLVNYLFSKTTRYYEKIAKQYEADKNGTCQSKAYTQRSEIPKEPKIVVDDFVVSKQNHGRNKYEASLNLLHTGDVKFTGLKNIGLQDEKVVQFVEERLMRTGYKKNDLFPCGLRNGLGKHYGGMKSVERKAVEMLFRMRTLNLVFATGTLALGIHMPCKTVAVVGDSRYLNSLEFQQMSGRAGRRGFDNAGNVVFMGLNERKIRRLLTDRLPQMVGNFPLSVSMVLRVLLMVSDITSGGSRTEEVTRDALSRYVLVLHIYKELCYS